MSLQELEEEIAKLNISERATLVQHLIESLQGPYDEAADAEIEKQWAKVAEKRLDDLEAGRAEEISLEEALRRAHDALS